METNIAWWGGLYIVATIGFMYFTWNIEDEEEPGRWDFIYVVLDMLCYLSLIAVTVLYFQTLDNPDLRYLFLGLSAYIVLLCSYYIIDCIKEFVKDPTGAELEEDSDEDEEAGFVLNAIAHGIPIAFYGCGMVIATIRSLGLL